MNTMMNPNPANTPAPPPPPRYKFRWGWVLAPLAIFIVLWLVNGIVPSFSFADIMHTLNVTNQEKYIQIACLAVVAVVITIIVKAGRS